MRENRIEPTSLNVAPSLCFGHFFILLDPCLLPFDREVLPVPSKRHYLSPPTPPPLPRCHLTPMPCDLNCVACPNQVLRRSMWNVFRLEWECIQCLGGAKAVRLDKGSDALRV